MNHLKFTGHSDDIISVHRASFVPRSDGRGETVREDEDELTARNGGANINVDVTKIKVSNIGGSRACLVYAVYDGTWSFSVSMLEESRKIPPWKITIDQPEHEYSTRLTIESHDDELIYEKV